MSKGKTHEIHILDPIEFPKATQEIDAQLQPNRMTIEWSTDSRRSGKALPESCFVCSPSFGAQSWVFEIAAILAALCLMVLALFSH